MCQSGKHSSFSLTIVDF